MRRPQLPLPDCMRVLIDATAMPAGRGGVARYVDELARVLNSELVLTCQPRDAEHYRLIAPRAIIVTGPAALRWRIYRLMWEQFAIPRIAKKFAVDAVHSPHYTLPLFLARPRIVTIHDVTFFSDQHVHHPVKALFFRAWIRISTRVADEIVVPSHATAQELERLVGFPANGALVAHHGVDHNRFSPPSESEIARVRARYDLYGPYVLFLGTIEPRKNVPALVHAHGQLAAGGPDAPLLVLAGGKGWESDLENALSEHPDASLVRSLGYIDDDDVNPLLGGSIVVAYPSHGEGFGLPVLEAMATGAVVLTTRHLAIPEVGGEAVAYTSTDATDISAALSQLIDDEPLRSVYSRLALERAAKFGWEASAAVHRVAYRSAATARLKKACFFKRTSPSDPVSKELPQPEPRGPGR